MWQRDGRDIKIDEELTISIKYTGDANTYKAVRLDNEIIPLLAQALTLYKWLRWTRDNVVTKQNYPDDVTFDGMTLDDVLWAARNAEKIESR